MIAYIPKVKTPIFGITKDRVKRQYAYIQKQLQWWADLPRHSGLELSGTMLQSLWARREFGKGDVVAHNPFRLMRDAVGTVLGETAATCREHGLPPDAYIDEAMCLLRGLFDSTYGDMVCIEAEARHGRHEREMQARRFTSPSQEPEKPRPVHEIARCLKQGIRQFEIENGIKDLREFLAEQGEAFKLLGLRQESGMPARTGKPSPQTDLISSAVAVRDYSVSRATLRREVEDKRLRDYRPEGHSHNAPLRLSRAEVANIWPKRGQ